MDRMTIVPKEALALQSGAARGAVRDDARLVAALRGGDDGAFASLVTDYQTAIYNLAWRLVRDREDARDIAQEVFLKAYRQIPKIEGELHLWAWLYRVTVNACLDHLRAGSRRPVTTELHQEAVDSGTADGEDQAELARLFAASLAQLSTKQQAALLLKDVHGLPHSDIAATLGISRGSSEVLLFRARRSFRHAFTSMTADVSREPVCRFAEQAAVYSVGGRLTEARRRRVLEHARTCPDCRKTVERWSVTRAGGLGLALPLVAAPELFGAHVATSAATNFAGSAAASSAASAGATAAASSGVSAAASGGASSLVGGLAAKLAGLGVTKAAAVVLAASTVVTYGGVTAYKDYAKDGGRRTAGAPVAAGSAHGGGVSASAGPAAPGPSPVTRAASGNLPVAGDRGRSRSSGTRWFLALGSLGPRGSSVRNVGLGLAARRAGLTKRFAARLAGARRPSVGTRPSATRVAGRSAVVAAAVRARPAKNQPMGRSGARPAHKSRPARTGLGQSSPPAQPVPAASGQPLETQ